MSGPLDLRFGALRVVCAETARKVVHSVVSGQSVLVRDVLQIEDGDLAVQVGAAGQWAALRQADRRAFAEAIAPPGALIGCPPEIAPLIGAPVFRDGRLESVSVMPPAPEVWMASDDEYRWSFTEEFATKEEAIAWIRAEFADDPDRPLWVGRKLPYEVESIADYMADDVIQKLGEAAYDECCEEEWPSPSKEDKKALGDELWRVLKRWIDEKEPPGFFRIEGIEEVPPLEPAEAGGGA